MSFKAIVNEKALKVINNVASIQVGNNPEITVDTDTVDTEILHPEPEPKPPVEHIPERAPQTGDGVGIGTWSTLSFGSLIICGYLLISEKRRKNEF